jgi:hypothetical protein
VFPGDSVPAGIPRSELQLRSAATRARGRSGLELLAAYPLIAVKTILGRAADQV